MEFLLGALLSFGIETNSAMNEKEELLKFKRECFRMQTCIIEDRDGYDQIVMNDNKPVDRFACAIGKNPTCKAKWVDGKWVTYPLPKG